MSRDFFKISPETSIGNAEKLMSRKGVRFLAVESQQEFQGMITFQDCEYFKTSLTTDGRNGPDLHLRLRHHKVREIMHRRLILLDQEDPISTAVEIIRSVSCNVIPIVRQNMILGIITPEIITKLSSVTGEARTARIRS